MAYGVLLLARPASIDWAHRHLVVGARDELHVRGALDLGVEGRRHLPLVQPLEVDVAVN